MNDYQTSKLKSYRAVVGVFDRYPDEVAALAALARSATWVREQVAALEQAAEGQAGYAPQGSAKAALREALSDAAVPVAQALSARADEEGDPAMADQFDFPPTDFLQGPEQDALDRAGITLAAAQGLGAAALAEYGAGQAEIDGLATAHTAFRDALSDPRDASVQRRAYTETIERLVPEINKRLKKRVDRMMWARQGTPFGDEYFAARTVVDA